MRRLLSSACACLLFTARAAASPADLDEAFTRFWAAKDLAAAVKAADAIARLGPDFDEVYRRLAAGRTYSKDVPTGQIQAHRPTLSGDFAYTLDVPEHYNPAHRYQVRVQLHGGVMRDATPMRGRGGNRLPGAEQIYVFPLGWNEAPWWTDSQLDNLRLILDTLKRTYNVDENSIVLTGISDGGTGTYYVAMRDTTPYSAFLPLNGAVTVLRNPALVGPRQHRRAGW